MGKRRTVTLRQVKRAIEKYRFADVRDRSDLPYSPSRRSSPRRFPHVFFNADSNNVGYIEVGQEPWAILYMANMAGVLLGGETVVLHPYRRARPLDILDLYRLLDGYLVAGIPEPVTVAVGDCFTRNGDLLVIGTDESEVEWPAMSPGPRARGRTRRKQEPQEPIRFPYVRKIQL